MLELAQIKSRQLTDLFQAVNQGVSMHKELSGGFGNVEVVLKERLNGHQSFAVKRLQASHDALRDVLAGGLQEGIA